MPEYIEREALLTHAIALNNPHELGECVVPVSDIEDAPAADVEPVRHGQWIAMHYEGGILDGTDVDKCSKCGAERVIEDPKYKTKYNYCPNCGAKMDGKRKEAT